MGNYKPNRPAHVRARDVNNGKVQDASNLGDGAAQRTTGHERSQVQVPSAELASRHSLDGTGWTPTPMADLRPLDHGRGTIPGADHFAE